MAPSSFQRWESRSFWVLLLGVCSFGVSRISSMSDSVGELNVKMAVVIEQIKSQGNQLADYGQRILRLENPTKHREGR